MKQTYETIIGLEVHVELATKTKIFCSCSTAFGGRPNTHTCPVCTGMPGTLPVLNRQVVEYALAVGLASNCSIHQMCRFDRKNYFYPDNPQNYQISQLYLPICHDGYVEIETEHGPKKIRIHEIHMEEDAGKLIHDEWEDCSLVDYNRSGVPLLEIVSEPDMRSANEVIAYLEKLQKCGNAMTVIYADEAAPESCQRLREKRLLYGIHYSYDETDREKILSESWLTAQEPLRPCFAFLHARDSCSLQTQNEIYQHVLAVRSEQKHPILYMELRQDIYQIDEIISDDACLVGFREDGSVHMRQQTQNRTDVNIFSTNLLDLLKTVALKQATAPSAEY